MEPITILIVDDEPDVEFLLTRKFQSRLDAHEWQFLFASTGQEAINRLCRYPEIAVVLSDIKMPELDGLTLLAHVVEIYPLICPVLMTAYHDVQTIRLAMNQGAYDFLTKPLNFEDVAATLDKAIQHHQRLRRLTSARQEAEQSLQRSARQYRQLVETIQDGVVIVHDDRIVFVNEALCAMLQQSFEQVRRLPFGQLIGDAASEMQETPWQIRTVRIAGRERFLEVRQEAIEWDGQPARMATIRDVTHQQEREQRLRQELRAAVHERYRFGELVGKSAAMQRVYEQILTAAATGEPVVLSGETGVGKELAARIIHRLSGRADQPFVPVHCGAIPSDLFESQFFGHRKGAFTGAYTDQPGYLDEAYHGVLFLDEVGELTPDQQVKLLRVLESGEYTPGGRADAQTGGRAGAVRHQPQYS